MVHIFFPSPPHSTPCVKVVMAMYFALCLQVSKCWFKAFTLWAYPGLSSTHLDQHPGRPWVQAWGKHRLSEDFCFFCHCKMLAGAPGRCSANELQAASSSLRFDYLPNLSKFLTSCFLFPPTRCPSGRHWIWGWSILIPGPAVLSVWTTQGSVALFIFPTCLVGGLAKREGCRLWVLENYLSGLLFL